MHVPFGGGRGYGYFWWIDPNGYAAEGVFGQSIIVFPKDRVVVAINSAWLKADQDEDWERMAAFAVALRDATRASSH
jgi:CubicO group peptidase (beta-lactamase class C family)